MKKPIIGIVGRIDFNTKSKNFVYDEYRLAIIKSGGIPILLLPTYEIDITSFTPFYPDDDNSSYLIPQMVNLCDGILFPGGDRWYGFEQEIYLYAYKIDKPILGICLGMQMIGCAPYFGKSNSDYTTLIQSNLVHQSQLKYVHFVTILDGKLKDIFNTNKILVNSRHSSALQPNDSFFISAKSDDDIIEAIEIPNKTFIVGVQWHPESLYDDDSYSQLLFQKFIAVCQRKSV
jgi:putative glutamine amidotransferase